MTTRTIRIVIDAGGAVAGGKRVEGALGKIQKGSKNAAGGLQVVKSALLAAVAGLSIRAITNAADQWTILGNRLRLVTDSTAEVNSVTDELVALTQRTRGPLAETADLYSRIARSSDQLGLSQREIIGLTESVNQAIKISGATAAEASGGVLQFGQALASGRLSGDELRSVLESMPRLARAIAAGMDVPIGALRAMGKAGTLSAEAVVKALQSQADVLNAEFASVDITISDAIESFKTFATVAIGSFFQASGAAEGIGQIFSLTAEDTVELKNTVISMGLAFKTATEIAALSVAIFVENVPNQFAKVQNTLTRFTAFLLDNEDVFLQTLLDEDAIDKKINDLKTNLTDAILDIQDINERRQDELIARAGSLDIKGEGADATDKLTKAEQRAADAREKTIATLEQEQAAIELAISSGRDFADVLEELEIREQGGEDVAFIDEALALIEANKEGQAYLDTRDELAEQEITNQEFLDQLQLENDALMIAVETGQELSDVLRDLEVAKQFEDDPEGLGIAQTLIAENDALKELLDDATDTVDDFLKRARENSQDVLAGFLSEPLSEGLDQLPAQFAGVLQDLAAQFLAAEIFSLLSGIGGGASGGQGLLSTIGGFFGGAQDGADVGRGDFGVVGEAGPEVFQAPAAGTIVPNQAAAAPVVNVSPQIINVQDPADIPAAMQSAEGESTVLNILRANPDVIRQVAA